ncbi:MAG: hypothetical protein ACTSYB_04890 [Candidatus Helarchaeota archaeon]
MKLKREINIHISFQSITEILEEKNIDLKIFNFTKLRKGIIEHTSYNLSEAYAAVSKIGVDLR